MWSILLPAAHLKEEAEKGGKAWQAKLRLTYLACEGNSLREYSFSIIYN